MTARIVILSLILFAFIPKGDKTITGRIYASDNPEFYSVANVLVILRSENLAFDIVVTDENGVFTSKISVDKKNIDILYSGLGFGTVYLRHINELNQDITNLQIDVAAKYKKNLFGKARCPKCNKTDLVYKIRYGDAPEYSIRVQNNGDTTYSPIHNGIYEAGTCLSSAQSARWYCDRDKIEF